jgi:phosphoadenosine phosphosulfate reductase
MNSNIKSEITTLSNKIEGLSIEASLQLLSEYHKGYTTFSTSFSLEDQTISHAILHNKLPIEIFTLDTGRNFPETYSVWNSTNERYQTQIKAYTPDYKQLENYLNKKGPNAFYESVDNRKECCHIRKVEPLKRALNGKKLWVTGLRSEHSAARQNLEMIEWDETHQLIKFHPLLYWTTEEVRQFINKNNIPYNTLQDKGFVSIGCAPCTRAIKPGEEFRAGRWWWEDDSKKECGLHENKVLDDKLI